MLKVARKKEESLIDLEGGKVKVQQIGTQISWNDQTVVLEKIENLQRSLHNEMAKISYKIRKIEDRKQEPSRGVDLNGQIICTAIRNQYTILRIAWKEKKRKEEEMMTIEEKRDLIEPEEEAMTVMRGGRTVNMMDSRRRKMKETEGTPSFNVLSQKNL